VEFEIISEAHATRTLDNCSCFPFIPSWSSKERTTCLEEVDAAEGMNLNEPELEVKLLRFVAFATAFVMVSTLNSFAVDVWPANDDMDSYCYYTILPF